MLDGFSTEAKRAIVIAQGSARSAGAELIGSAHLFYGLLASGGAASGRLAALGLTAEAVGARVSAAPDHPLPPPMSPQEAREFRRQLKARGVAAAKAEQLIWRVQRQRGTGPVEFDAGALAALKARARDHETTVPALLRALFASPAPDLVALTDAAGTTPDAVRRALADL